VEALVATVALLVLIAAALAVLGRSWPSSSRRGGFRTWMRSGSSDGESSDSGSSDRGSSDRGSSDRGSSDEERGEAEREDDDARWHWDDRKGDDDG
jgi:hypothetical protein